MKGAADARGPHTVQDRMAAFERRCAEKGLAMTHQRYVIYRALAASGEHLAPEAVYEAVRREIPSVSLATVYKNIKTFVEAGLLREVSLPHQSVRLDANIDPHHHLVCSSCKAIFDLDQHDVAPVRFVSEPRGFQVNSYHVQFSGLCAACAARESK